MKKSKKKKAKKNRKESSGSSSEESEEEEDDPAGVMWVEKTSMDENVVGPEAPFTQMSQDDRPLEWVYLNYILLVYIGFEDNKILTID